MHRTDSGLIGFGPIASALWTLCLSWELYRFLARVAKDVHGVWSQSLSSNINDPLLFQSTNAGRFSRTRYKVYHAVTWVPAILLTGGTYAMASVTTTGPSGCAIQLTLLFNRTHQVLGVGSKMVTKHTRLCSPSTSPSPSVWSGVWHYMPVFVYVNTPCSSTTWESTPHAHHKRLPQNLRPHILCISLAFSASPPRLLLVAAVCATPGCSATAGRGVWFPPHLRPTVLDSTTASSSAVSPGVCSGYHPPAAQSPQCGSEFV